MCSDRDHAVAPRWRLLLPLGIVLAGILAYSNSFSGAFVFDDHARILNDPNVRRLSTCMLNSSRPLVGLTLYLNCLMSGFSPADYHALNLAVHLAAGLALFGVVRRTLVLPCMADRYGATAPWLAAFTAAIWLVHPLQTQSVTYLIQRAESLMGLFYLLTLYAFIRSTAGAVGHRWQTAAAVFCALGMVSKPVMVTAPCMVLLYDRAFVSGSFRRALGSRRAFYAALAATWIIPAALLSAPTESAATAGFGTRVVSPLSYLSAQPGVILHYLRLAAVPAPLCLDYAWPVPQGWEQVFAPALVILGMAALAILASARRWPVGFAGLWFLVVLAPSSSVVPVADLAVEHRMYLPLAAVAAGCVLGVFRALLHPSKTQTAPARRRRVLAVTLGLATVAVLTGATRARNADYASERRLWQDVAAHRPGNLRARDALIGILLEEGKFEEAASAATNLIALIREVANGKASHAVPASVAAYCYPRAEEQLGRALMGQGRGDEAIRHFMSAIQASPSNAVPYHNLALALVEEGRAQEALKALDVAVALDPRSGRAYGLMASIRERQGDYGLAAALYRRAISRDPGFVLAKQRLAWLLATCPDAATRDGAAARQLATAVCAATGYRSARAMETLAAAYAECGEYQRAAESARAALRMASSGEDREWRKGDVSGAGALVDARSALMRAVELYDEGKPFRAETGRSGKENSPAESGAVR